MGSGFRGLPAFGGARGDQGSGLIKTNPPAFFNYFALNYFAINLYKDFLTHDA